MLVDTIVATSAARAACVHVLLAEFYPTTAQRIERLQVGLTTHLLLERRSADPKLLYSVQRMAARINRGLGVPCTF